ncbi:cardiolipin synthase [Arthrobacter yangruifuii]|uniref:cardiolipin synthase n=1 Tax=Arthrobacter yangruifuii TaxID=2606616 RepID=UPI0011B81A71
MRSAGVWWSLTGFDFTGWVAAVLTVVDYAIRIIALGVVPGNRRPTTAMAWLLCIFFLPIPGIILFSLFGNHRLSEHRVSRQAEISRLVRENTNELEAEDTNYGGPEWVLNAAELNRRLGSFPTLDGNKVELQRDYAESIAEMTEAVRTAKRYVHVEFYIIGYDAVTRDFFRALTDAAERGVTVRLLFDHIGTIRIPGYRKLLRELRGSHIQWRRMLPVEPFRGHWRRPDLRNHRKILVVDGAVAFTGSQNLVEPAYNKRRNHRSGRKWVELMARVEGPVVDELSVVFATDWNAETDENLERELSLYDWSYDPGNVTCQVVPSGPGFSTENNLRLFASLIYSASDRISITSPYFVPDDTLLYAVTTAAQRGVAVELFVSEKGDQFLVDHAQRSYYEALLRAGVRIYQYPKPLVLHAKHFTIDNEVAVLGSSNMDMRSFSLNLEVSVMMFDGTIVEQMRRVEDTYRSLSKELILDNWVGRPVWQRYIDNVARLTATLQ